MGHFSVEPQYSWQWNVHAILCDRPVPFKMASNSTVQITTFYSNCKDKCLIRSFNLTVAHWSLSRDVIGKKYYYLCDDRKWFPYCCSQHTTGNTLMRPRPSLFLFSLHPWHPALHRSKAAAVHLKWLPPSPVLHAPGHYANVSGLSAADHTALWL